MQHPDPAVMDELDERDTADGDGLLYDPAMFGQFADEIDVFPMDGCVMKRGDRELYMFRGQSFAVHPVIPASLTNAWMAFAGGGEARDLTRVSDTFDALCAGLARCLPGWDLVDPVTGEDYPQPWRNPAVFHELPTEALYYILQTVAKGEVPEARPNASTPRRGGSGIPRSSAQRTRSTSTGRRHR